MQKCFQVLKLDLKKLVFFSIYSSLFKIWYWTKNVSFRKVKCNLWRKLVKWGKKRQNPKCNFGWRNNWIWKLRLPTCSNNKIQFLQIYLGSENGPCSCLQFHFFFFFFFSFYDVVILAIIMFTYLISDFSFQTKHILKMMQNMCVISSDSHLLKKCLNCFNESPLKYWKMLFILS